MFSALLSLTAWNETQTHQHKSSWLLLALEPGGLKVSSLQFQAIAFGLAFVLESV